MVPITYKCCILLAVGLAFTGYIFLSLGLVSAPQEIRPSYSEDTVDNLDFIINTKGCNIVNANAFSESVLPFYKPAAPFQCENKKNVSFGLVYMAEKKLHVNITIRNNVLDHYQTNASNFYCCVDFIKRFSDEEDDKASRIVEECTKFTEELVITDEFMDITCYVEQANQTNLIYQNFDFAVIRKSHVEARCRAFEAMEQLRGTACEDQLSVLIMGIDSVSRLQSIRQLNRTRQTLQRMDAVEFVGYSRVGLNTFPNLGAAILAGKTADELDQTCIDNAKMLDNCTFLFDYFAAAGYRTAFVEDMNRYATFAWARNGFRRQMTDYYGRILFNKMDQMASRPGCFRGGAGASEDEAVFQWAVEYQIEFANDKHFGLFWISEFSHNYMNTLVRVDKFMPELLERFAAENGKLLNNTLLVVMGDHGLRFSDLAKTEVGRLEMNLPMMFLVFPSWFRQKHYRAMQRLEENARGRLTTHFDLHATLSDVASCRGPFSNSKEDLSPASPARGISLFESITTNRSCQEAGIPIEFCPCSTGDVTLLLEDDKSTKLGRIAVDKLNEMTASQRSLCAKLDLQSVDRVKFRKLSVEKSDKLFTVILTTTPGNGTFEISVGYNASNKAFVVTNNVMRLNQYGNSSDCIHNTYESHLFPICYCALQ